LLSEVQQKLPANEGGRDLPLKNAPQIFLSRYELKLEKTGKK
jgi:hypothetical protein